MARSDGCGTISGASLQSSVCTVCGMVGCMEPKQGTHRDHGERAARVDHHAIRSMELGVRSDAVAGALDVAPRERAGLPRGKLDAANAVIAKVLRCMGAAVVRAKPTKGLVALCGVVRWEPVCPPYRRVQNGAMYSCVC